MNQWSLAVLVFLPMAAAPVSWLIGSRSERGRDAFAAAVALAELLLAAGLFFQSPGVLELSRVCGLGIAFQSGGLRSVLALLAAIGWLVGTLMLREYFAHAEHKNRYYVFWLLTLGATVGVFLSADLFTTFIFFEMMSFTSFVMVIHTEKPEALRAADTYLAVAVVCGLVTLTGLFLLWHLTGTLRIDDLYGAVQAVGESPMLWTAGILTSVGFLAKAGAFPMHIWLPTAHPAAPAPASGVLSGVIIKSGVFGVLVVSTQVFRFQALWGNLILILGLITMVIGAVLAVFSIDLKRTLACSSVSQIGFILVGIGMQCLLGEEGTMAASGTLLHLVNHASIKTILFPAAGVIYCSTHCFDLNRIRGFGRKKPWLRTVVLIPMLSLAGVPGFSGYVSKTLLHESIVEYAHHLGGSVFYTAAEWVFLITGGLTVAYLLKLFVAVFLEQPLPEAEWDGKKRYMSLTSGLTLSCCALALLPLGIRPNQLMERIAAFAMPFMTDGELHPVQYFTGANLVGALISLTIGVAVYLLVVRRLLVKEINGERYYVDRWPGWLNLEEKVYRPLLLKLLPALGGGVAWAAEKLVDVTVGVGALVGPIIARTGETLVDGTVALMGKALYHKQTSTVEPDLDPDFAAFSNEPPPRKGFRYSFAFTLMLMGLGMAGCLLYLILA